MAKLSIKSSENKEDVSRCDMKEIRDTLREQHACYVLLTCSEPSEEGEMQAKMYYEGDEVLASYLIENAKDILTEDACLENSC